MLTSCGDSSKTKTEKLASLPPDTIRLDSVSKRDMLIILSILPDTITKSFHWSKADRVKLRRGIETKGYFVDSTHSFLNLKTFENNYVEFQSADASIRLNTYQISDGHYLVLIKEQRGNKQVLTPFELYKISAVQMDMDLILGKYKYEFLKDPSDQNCLGMLYNKNPEFDYDITSPDVVIISMKNYSKDDSKECLKGNRLTLKFNKIKSPFDVVGIDWLDN